MVLKIGTYNVQKHDNNNNYYNNKHQLTAVTFVQSVSSDKHLNVFYIDNNKKGEEKKGRKSECCEWFWHHYMANSKIFLTLQRDSCGIRRRTQKQTQWMDRKKSFFFYSLHFNIHFSWQLFHYKCSIISVPLSLDECPRMKVALDVLKLLRT